jgi:hypothetical protein
MVTIYEIIINEYPELTEGNDRLLRNGTIEVRNDSDGVGDYLAIWNYSKPIPEGLTLGKPSA